MKRIVAITALIAALGTVALVGVVRFSAAQQSQEAAADRAWMNAAELEAMDLLDKDKPLAARRHADAILKNDDQSVIGHYVLGRVLHEHESSLGRAVYHLGRARELYEERYPLNPRPPDAPWKFHRDLLFSIQALVSQMEEYEYQLKMLDYHDALYRPELVAEHAWPLFKLGRIDEAHEVAERAASLRDPGQRSLGLNVLCAIENARHARRSALDACEAALKHARAVEKTLPTADTEHHSTLAVHAYNAALAARQAFEPERAEKLAREGTQRLAFTPANPWRFLVGLYLDQGRGQKAVEALREMHRWRMRQPPQIRDQDRAETDVQFATVLLLAGRTRPAVGLVDRAIEKPDRRGLTSIKPWQTLGAHALLRRALRRADREIRAEAESMGIYDSGWLPDWMTGRGLSDWADEERIVGVLSDDDRLVDTFRIFGESGLTPVPTWLLGDLVEVLGPGVVTIVIREVEERDSTFQLEPYLRAVEVDVHMARGRDRQAMKLADEVLRELPASEVLLRARVAARAAEAAGNAGDERAELEYLEQAFVLDPSAIRRFGLSLPVQVRSSGGEDASALARLLKKSPRLRKSQSGFTIDVAAAGGEFRFCINSPTGAQLTCADTTKEREQRRKPEPSGESASESPEGEETLPTTPLQAAEVFHRKMFSFPLGLTGLDMSSLDGSTTVSEQAARDRLEGVLDQMMLDVE